MGRTDTTQTLMRRHTCRPRARPNLCVLVTHTDNLVVLPGGLISMPSGMPPPTRAVGSPGPIGGIHYVLGRMNEEMGFCGRSE